MTGYAIETSIGELTRHATVDIGIEPGPGEAIARIDLAAITANNVTYAVHHGPPLHYGRFYPSSDPSSRIIVPLWGFATITASRAEGISEGDRFYGYWPAASHARLRPGPVRHGGFDCTAPHRAGQAGVYNHYVPAAAVAATLEEEAFAALFRPLFGTAFALDDALGREPAANTIILTSASSKTALGTAWLLGRRPGLRVIGLTADHNREFTLATGCYTDVRDYCTIESLDAGTPSVLVDFAGNGVLKARLHDHLTALVASHIVGDTHWAEPQALNLPGPAPTLFFAPTSIARMVARDGAPAFQAALAAAMTDFSTDAAQWMTVIESHGEDGFTRNFNTMAEGRSYPAQGHVWQP